MSTTVVDNKRFILDYLAALSGHAKTDALIDEYVSDPGLKEHIRQAEDAFPEYELIAYRVAADGDLVAVHGFVRGLHKGEFAGIKATGRSISADLMIFYRVAEGRIAEHWLQLDTKAILDQLSS